LQDGRTLEKGFGNCRIHAQGAARSARAPRTMQQRREIALVYKNK